MDEARPLIFVSHSSRDKLVADAICARLEGQGIRCWIAPRDVNPGGDYSDQIAEALEKSTVMVMVFSSGSNSSRHVKSEIDRAFSLGQIIIPFRVENVEPEKGLAYYLSKTHWLDAVTPPLEQHIDRLAATIRKLSGSDLPPAAVAPSAPPLSRSAVNSRLFLLAGLAALAVIIVVGGFLLLAPGSKKSAVEPSVAVANAAAPLAIAGTWTIAEARSADGTAYTGTVRFTPQGERYQVAWETSAGNFSGIGLVRGNKLCAAWSAESFGVVFYHIGKDGTLEGPWTVIGAKVDQSDGIEKATGGVPGKLEGRYQLAGTNPGAQNTYGGELVITSSGETFQLQWNVEGSLTNGVGIKIDNELFVAWGGPGTLGVIGYRLDKQRAQGVWTLAGASQTGVENLTK